MVVFSCQHDISLSWFILNPVPMLFLLMGRGKVIFPLQLLLGHVNLRLCGLPRPTWKRSPVTSPLFLCLANNALTLLAHIEFNLRPFSPSFACPHRANSCPLNNGIFSNISQLFFSILCVGMWVFLRGDVIIFVGSIVSSGRKLKVERWKGGVVRSILHTMLGLLVWVAV